MESEDTLSHNVNTQPLILGLIPQNLAGKSILDIGVGYGYWGYLLRTQKRGAPRIVGVEPWKPYAENAGQTSIYDEIHEATAQEYLTKHSETFDLILICEVIAHLGTKQESWNLLKDLEGRLNPGGMLILAMPDGHSTELKLYDENPFNAHPLGFNASELEHRGYAVERVIKSFFNLGHVIGPIAYVWWTLRWGRRLGTHTLVAWKVKK